MTLLFWNFPPGVVYSFSTSFMGVKKVDCWLICCHYRKKKDRTYYYYLDLFLLLLLFLDDSLYNFLTSRRNLLKKKKIHFYAFITYAHHFSFSIIFPSRKRIIMTVILWCVVNNDLKFAPFFAISTMSQAVVKVSFVRFLQNCKTD